MAIKRAKTYTVIYRTGGTENFKWHKVLTHFTDYESARKRALEIERQGYKTIIHDTDKLNTIGMPDNASHRPKLLF